MTSEEKNMHAFLNVYVHLSGELCKSQIKFACNKNIIKNPKQTLQSFIFSGIRTVCWMHTRGLLPNIMLSDIEVGGK